MCSITGVGERLHKVLGQIDLGTLDSGERSLPFGLPVLEFWHFCKFGHLYGASICWGYSVLQTQVLVK